MHVGEYADIHLNAYPKQTLKGRIDNILPVLDPNIRTAKVRIEVKNPGMLRIGMFATATFYGKQPEMHAAVPGQLRSCTCTTASGFTCRSATAVSGARKWSTGSTATQQPTGNRLGIKPGDQVVSNALDLQNTVEQ